jgi:hypothetical protein
LRFSVAAALTIEGRYKELYRERVERQYKTVNPNATPQVVSSISIPLFAIYNLAMSLVLFVDFVAAVAHDYALVPHDVVDAPA